MVCVYALKRANSYSILKPTKMVGNKTEAKKTSSKSITKNGAKHHKESINNG